MTVYASKDIMAEFLTARLTDPRGRLATQTLTYSPDGSTATFDLEDSNTVTRAVTDVRVDGTSLSKWEDYEVDIRADEYGGDVIITSQTAASLSGSTVEIDVKHGNETWIYPDIPRPELSKDKYPRLGILTTQEPGERQGTYKAKVDYFPNFRVEAFSKEDQVFTVSGREYEGDRLVWYLLARVNRMLEEYEDDLYPKLHTFRPTSGPRDVRKDRERDAFRSNSEFTLTRTSIGEDE